MCSLDKGQAWPCGRWPGMASCCLAKDQTVYPVISSGTKATKFSWGCKAGRGRSNSKCRLPKGQRGYRQVGDLGTVVFVGFEGLSIQILITQLQEHFSSYNFRN